MQPGDPSTTLSSIEDFSIQTGHPYEIAWEMTQRCGLDCRHCYLGKKLDRNELGLEQAKVLLDKLKDAGAIFLILTGGEPTLHPEFYDIAEYARKKRFALRLYTAGFHLKNTDVARLADIGFGKIDISIMGIGDTHDRFVRVPGAFEKTRDVIGWMKDAGLRVHLKSTVTSDNYNQIGRIREFADRMGCSYQHAHFLGWQVDSHAPSRADPPTYNQAVHMLMKEGGKNKKVIQSHPPEEGLLCGAGSLSWSIAPNGDVFPCLMLREKCGNLVAESFDEIMNSPQMLSVRGMSLKDLHGCKGCSVSEFCNRCPGQSFIEHGDFNASNAEACREAGACFTANALSRISPDS